MYLSKVLSSTEYLILLKRPENSGSELTEGRRGRDEEEEGEAKRNDESGRGDGGEERGEQACE